MKIVSWNINSIKARTPHVKRFITEEAPDILMLQELKGIEFPENTFKSLGFTSFVKPQKAYNGVAILSKHPAILIADNLQGDDKDEQSRYIEVDINGVRIINIYAPNGNPVHDGDTYHEKYTYKLAWLERLYKQLKSYRDTGREFIIGGDFNIIPHAKDCYDAKKWEDDALFRLPSRHAYQKILNLGLTEAFRVFDTRAEQYTFWDYQAGARQKNNGIRIDHFLLSPLTADKLLGCEIHEAPRDWERPSDHTPIVIDIDI